MNLERPESRKGVEILGFEIGFLGFSYDMVQHPEDEQKCRTGENGALAENTERDNCSVAEFPLDVPEDNT